MRSSGLRHTVQLQDPDVHAQEVLQGLWCDGSGTAEEEVAPRRNDSKGLMWSNRLERVYQRIGWLLVGLAPAV